MRSSAKKILLAVNFITVFYFSGIAQTNVSGFINANTIWNTAGSPYLITGNALLSQGYTLTIEPGVIVKFSSNTALQIDGQMIAIGTLQNRITFTSSQANPNAGDWGKLHISDMATDAVLDGSGNYLSGTIMKYCDVLYGGSLGAGAVHIESSSPYFSQCRIRYSSASGIRCSGAIFSIDSSVVSNCLNYGLYYDQVPSGCSGILNVRNDSILSNTGGGIRISDWSTCLMQIESCYFISNSNGIDIGNECSSSIHSVGFDRIYITENKFVGNTNYAMFMNGCADLKIAGNYFANNISSNYPGGIITLNRYTRATISENYFQDNTVGDYQNTSCLYYGKVGVLTLSGSNTTIECNKFIHNETKTNGAGGIYMRSSGKESIRYNIFDGNFNNVGGACAVSHIYADGGSDTIKFTNNIIKNNSAPSGSSCIFSPNLATNNQLLQIINNEFIANTAQNVIDLEGSQINNSSFDFMYMKYNNFLDVGTRQIYNHIPYGSPNVYAGNNFWGSSNVAHTDSIIYDYFDDANNSVVYYSPIRNSPVQIDTACSSGSSGFESTLTKELNIIIYPNPASTILNLSLPVSVTGNQIKIFNLLGELQTSKSITGQQIGIDISKLVPGIYLFELSLGENIICKKFIKQ